MKRLTPAEIRAVYDQGSDAVARLVTELFDVIDRLEANGAKLERQVQRAIAGTVRNRRPPMDDLLSDPGIDHTRAHTKMLGTLVNGPGLE